MANDNSTAPDIDGGMPAELVPATRIDVVVDVQAASRYGAVADMAHQRSTLVANGQIVTTSTTVPVFEAGDQFKVTVHVPPAWASLDGTFTMVVLLPAATDDYEARLVTWTEDYAPQVFDGVDLPTLGGRPAVVWVGTGSAAELIYQLLPPGR